MAFAIQVRSGNRSRFFRWIGRSTREFITLHDARKKLRAWQEDYNYHRPPGSLGYLAPSEFVKKSSV
jgi:transposase InsO family protein